MSAKKLLKKVPLKTLVLKPWEALPAAAAVAAIVTQAPHLQRQLVEKRAGMGMELNPRLGKSVDGDGKKRRVPIKVHRYVGPSLASALTGGAIGAAIAPKGVRIKTGAKGAAIGGANALLWRLLTRGYNKSVGIDK